MGERALVRTWLCVVRTVLVVVLGVCLWSVATAKSRASAVETLMVSSAAMGRDVAVVFQDGGPRAVVLSDALNAAPEVSNWVSVAGALNAFAGKGVSMVVPAGGAYSLYTDWEADGSR